MQRIAYLGWLGAGNLGDEGCYQLFRERVRSISTNIECIPITIRESQGALFAHRPDVGTRAREAWRPESFDYVVLGGGSLLNADRYIEALALAQAADVPTAIWGSGFDGLPHDLVPHLIDGEGAPTGARDAAPVPHPCMPEVFRACRVAGVRGPVTAAWLRSNGCRSPAVSGDPGLLLCPRPRQATPPPSHITVIWGMSHRATHDGTPHEELTNKTARWLNKISSQYRPVICAMWSHDIPAARQLAEEVGAGALFVQEPLALESFRALMSRTAWTLSYRLHGCIFSAACGTPFCSIAYRSKCYDFAHSVQAGAWVLDPGDDDFEERLDFQLSHEGGSKASPIQDSLNRHATQHRKSLMETLQAITRELEEGA